MASGMYNPGRQAFGLGDIHWDTDDIEALLVLDTYTFDPTEQYVSEIVGELTATDYVRKNVANRAVSNATTTTFTADNVTWPGLGGAVDQIVGGAILFLNVSDNDAISPLICFIDTADILTIDFDLVLAFAGGVVFTLVG
jgi:hypothetical protein